MKARRDGRSGKRLTVAQEERHLRSSVYSFLDELFSHLAATVEAKAGEADLAETSALLADVEVLGELRHHTGVDGSV